MSLDNWKFFPGLTSNWGNKVGEAKCMNECMEGVEAKCNPVTTGKDRVKIARPCRDLCTEGLTGPEASQYLTSKLKEKDLCQETPEQQPEGAPDVSPQDVPRIFLAPFDALKKFKDSLPSAPLIPAAPAVPVTRNFLELAWAETVAVATTLAVGAVAVAEDLGESAWKNREEIVVGASCLLGVGILAKLGLKLPVLVGAL